MNLQKGGSKCRKKGELIRGKKKKAKGEQRGVVKTGDHNLQHLPRPQKRWMQMSPDESDIMTCKTLQDHTSTWSKDGQELKLSGMREPQLGALQTCRIS